MAELAMCVSISILPVKWLMPSRPIQGSVDTNPPLLPSPCWFMFFMHCKNQGELKQETLSPEDGWENEIATTGAAAFMGYLLHSRCETSLSRL